MSAWEPVRPAYFTLPLLPVDSKPPAEWFAGATRMWGTVALRLAAAPDSPLHVGSGAPRPAAGSLAAAHASVPRRRGSALVEEPVVPGSSLKGAVRVVVEALTPSCDPLGPSACRAHAVCPSCLVFGTAGRRGLVGFGEAATPPEAGPPGLQHRRLAQRYSHPRAPQRGRRLYGPEPESPLPRATEVLEVLPGGSVLVSTVVLDGVPDWGVGLVTIALGVGPLGLPCLRLGAGKNRDMGILHCEVTAGSYAETLAAAAGGARRAVSDEVIGWWQQAATARFGVLRERREAIRQGYGG